MEEKTGERGFRLILYLPTLIFLILMTIFPLIFSIYISFFDYTLGQHMSFVGFGNYGSLLTGPAFWSALKITLQIAVLAVTIEIFLGIFIAFLFNTQMRGVSICRMIVFIPMMLSPLVVGFLWKHMFDAIFGIINYFFGLLGGPQTISWFTNVRLALLAIVIVDLWEWTPFVALLATAGLQAIPPKVAETVRLEKASLWLRFRVLYLPYLRFPLMVAVLIRSIDTLKIFDQVYVLTGGSPGESTVTLSMYVYRLGFNFFYTGKAAALSWLMALISVGLLTILIRVLARKSV